MSNRKPSRASYPLSGPTFRLWLEIKSLQASLDCAVEHQLINASHVEHIDLGRLRGLWTAKCGLAYMEIELLENWARINEALNDPRLESLLKKDFDDTSSIISEIKDDAAARKFIEKVRIIFNKIGSLSQSQS